MNDNLDVYNTGRGPVVGPPVLLTTNYATIFQGHCIVEFLAFANADPVNDIDVSVQSGSGSPFLPTMTVPAGKTEFASLPPGGIYFPGGLSIKAATGGIVTAWFRIRQV